MLLHIPFFYVLFIFAIQNIICCLLYSIMKRNDETIIQDFNKFTINYYFSTLAGFSCTRPHAKANVMYA